MATRDVRLTVGTISKALLWVVYVWVFLNLVLLFLAFVLRLLGANPEADFTQWVYRSVSRSMAPFRGMFEPIPLNDQSVLDTSLLFAMIVYGLAALFLRAGIDWAGELIARRRRRLEQEVWDDRLETMSSVGSPRSEPPPVAGTPQQTTYSSVVVPASPSASPVDQPPPR